MLARPLAALEGLATGVALPSGGNAWSGSLGAPQRARAALRSFLRNVTETS